MNMMMILKELQGLRFLTVVSPAVSACLKAVRETIPVSYGSREI